MKKIISVYGAARTGSTMIGLMLGNDPDGFLLGEVYRWFYPSRTHHFDLKCACGSYPCAVWEEIKNFNRKHFYAKALQTLDMEFLVDTSKNLPWVIDGYERSFKNGRPYVFLNVLIYKSPISLYYSYWKRGNPDIRNLTNAYRTYAQFFRSGLPFIAVNYDKLVEKPGYQLKKLCSVLEIPYFQEKQQFWTKHHHHLFGSAGARQQVFNGESAVYKEKYTPEFATVLRNQESFLNTDPVINKTLDTLERNNIDKVARYPSQTGKVAVKKGAVYYKKKLRQCLKRFHPDQHPDREAEFIRQSKNDG